MFVMRMLGTRGQIPLLLIGHCRKPNMAHDITCIEFNLLMWAGMSCKEPRREDEERLYRPDCPNTRSISRLGLDSGTLIDRPLIVRASESCQALVRCVS